MCYKCGDRHKADDCIFVPSIENTVALKRRTDLNEPAPTKKFALVVPAGRIRMPTSIALDEMRKMLGVFLRLTDIAVRS